MVDESNKAAEENKHRSNYSGAANVNQETERIYDVLFEIYSSIASQGNKWLRVHELTNYLIEECGYEDEDELNDCLGDTLINWMENDDRFTIRDEPDNPGSKQFSLELEPPEEEWTPRRLRISFSETKELWRVLHKSRNATVYFPDSGFVICREGTKHRSDSVYNHIASALTNVVTSEVAAVRNSEATLQALLDCDKPFTMIVDDPSGFSRFPDMENVSIEQIPEGENYGFEDEEGESGAS